MSISDLLMDAEMNLALKITHNTDVRLWYDHFTNEWVVSQRKFREKKSKIIFQTNSEELVVNFLLGKDY